MKCECGHEKSGHIHEEGDCRSGVVCPCQKFKRAGGDFQVGDKVRAPTIFKGIGEIICKEEKEHLVWILDVKTWDDRKEFHASGKYYSDAEESALILVEPAKATQKVKIERWITVHHHPEIKGDVSCAIHSTKEFTDAESNSPEWIKTVKFETEVEIEE